MTPIEQLEALSDSQKAANMAKYHKAKRVYLGVANPDIDKLCKEWRAECDLDARLQLATTLWDSDIFEARVAAAKLLTQARIRPDDATWEQICRWVPQFDCWAIADHVCSAGGRRLAADPSRIETLEGWTTDENMWVRRAALVMTLPFTKQNHPNAAENAVRERVLGWAAGYVEDQNWFIQKSISWWLRSLSGHDPARAQAFIDAHGDKMKPFAVRDAIRKIKG